MEGLIRTGSSEERQGYDVSYSQLSRGSFKGKFTGTRWDVDRLAKLAPQATIANAELPPSGALEYLSVQRYGPRVRIRGASPGDRTAFYVVGPDTKLVRFRGIPVAPGSVIVVPPTAEMDFLIEHLELATFSFDQANVDSIWKAAGDPAPADTLVLSTPTGTSLFELGASMLADAEGGLGDRAAVSRFEEAFINTVASGRPIPSPRRGARTRFGVRRVEGVLHDSLSRPIPSHALAQVAGLPLRTLQDAFRREFGVGPQRYHALLRMRAARLQLLEGHPNNTRVADAATAHGFVHLGRFAVTYRDLFGETPSATLGRRSS